MPGSELKPLLNLPIPSNLPSLRRALGMFAHFAHWIPSFAEKVYQLTAISKFPLPPHVIRAFEDLKRSRYHNAAITTFDPSPRLVVETNALDCAIAASLRQSGRPVAFFSRTSRVLCGKTRQLKKRYTLLSIHLKSGDTI